MRRLVFVLVLGAVVFPARADTAGPANPQPDPSRPVTLTLSSLQRMMDAARAEGAAACLAQGVRPEIEDVLRQATPSPAKLPHPSR